MRKLVLFDIDGTILNTGKIGSGAIYGAVEAVCRQAGAIKEGDIAPVSPLGKGESLRRVRMSGKTDTQIVHEILEGVVPPDTIQRLLPRIFDGVAERLAGHNHDGEPPILLEGAQRLIEAVDAHHACLPGLLTGNNRRGAEAKLEMFSLAHFFKVGAFGDDAHFRQELPEIAVNRAFEKTGYRYTGKEVVIIGDTPNDVTCGKHLNVCAIAVATGRFSSAELQAAQPDFLFDNLSDTERVMAAILSR